MTKKKKVVGEAAETISDNNINISLEQICAAILSSVGSVEVTLEKLTNSYESYSISVTQDEITKAVTFGLVENKPE